MTEYGTLVTKLAMQHLEMFSTLSFEDEQERKREKQIWQVKATCRLIWDVENRYKTQDSKSLNR